MKKTHQKKFSGLGKIRVRGHLNYREIIRRFERQSTFHGISHAALAPNTKWRIIWYTAFTVCFCALLIQIFLLIRRYRLYAKTVDLDLKFENAPFPSVTLCNLNPYKASMISKEEMTKATMDAFSSIVESGVESYGISAAIEAVRKKTPPKKRATDRTLSQRRYHQAFAQCICEMNSLTGSRKKGSCFAAYRGNVSILFADATARFHPGRCICQLDWVSKTLWPCFPYNTWKERMCTECSKELGHCPMRFYMGSGDVDSIAEETDVCLCHKEYNHCIANNDYGYILEIGPKTDVSSMNLPSVTVTKKPTTTTTTTQAPELKEALGFQGLSDEIAIKEQAKENLMFAVGQMNDTRKVQMSQQKEELILKCSFNQKDCDIQNDFKLHYDQTYGNCFTFNWNRTKTVTAHRAGANFGLRVMLFADASEYLPTSESLGFRITVHDKSLAPFPDAFGYNAPTGFLSSFGVRMKQFNRIPAPHGACRDHSDNSIDSLYHGFNYSVEGCHRSCTQKEVIRICGCADPAYPVPPGTPSCRVSDPLARNCIKNSTQHLGRLIAEGLLQNCICHQPCSEVNYEVTYSAARWPSGTTKVMECEPVDDLCMEKYRKNAAMVQIFYEELNYETLTETPAYTLTSALADLGGLTGLWIGASVVSLLEIAALIVYTVQAYVRKKRKASSSAAFRIANPSIYPKYVKRSFSSLSTFSDEQSFSEENDRKISAVSKQSQKLPNNMIERKPTPTERKLTPNERKLTPAEKKQTPVEVNPTPEDKNPPEREHTLYIPPGADLPCDCTYSKRGKLKVMNALCPEHGYLVRRRGTECRIYFGDSSTEEMSSESEGQANDDTGSSDERRRMYSTDNNSLRLHSSMI